MSKRRFVDWPPTIGIDNLCINCPGPNIPTPEPASLTLLGTGLFALVRKLRKKV